MRRLVGYISIFVVATILLTNGGSRKPSIAAAQAATPVATSSANCDLSSVFKSAGALKASGDNSKDLAALLDLARNIQDADFACNSMTFTGNGNFSSDVFDFRPGVYKVKVQETGLTDDNLVSVELISVDTENQNCQDQFIFQDTVTSTKDTITASKKYATFGNAKSCRVTMVVTAASDWKITFTVLK